MVAPNLSATLTLNLDELIASHWSLIRWLAWRRYWARDCKQVAVDPDDLAQEIALRAVKRFRRFDASRSSFKTWLGLLARDAVRDVRQTVMEQQGDAKTLSATATAGGEEFDRLASVRDSRADDPACGVALARVLVPVEKFQVGAMSVGWVRDTRTGQRVRVPSADVVTVEGRLFALGWAFDEDGEGLYRVRFANEAVGWFPAVACQE